MTTNEIYYFSGTGNSKKIAIELAKRLPDSTLISLATNNHKKIKAHGRVGLVFPVYSLGIPMIVENVIKSMDLSEVNYIYAVVTMGGGYGIVFQLLDKLLRKKDKYLSASFSLIMGSNSNLFIKIPGTSAIRSAVEQDELYQNAQVKLEKIIDLVQSEMEIHEPTISLSAKLISKMANAAFKSNLSKFDREFHTSNCKQCGICAKNCPVNNIEMKESKPKWLGKCEACLRCFNICPNTAILYGKMDHPKMFEHYTTINEKI